MFAQEIPSPFDFKRVFELAGGGNALLFFGLLESLELKSFWTD